MDHRVSVSSPDGHKPSPSPAAFPRHGRMPSLHTQASGVADSTISFGSFATGEEPVRLSQFPTPPLGIPPPSPSHSVFSASSPSSPYPPRSPMTPASHSRRPLPQPTTAPLLVRRGPSGKAPTLTTIADDSSSGSPSQLTPPIPPGSQLAYHRPDDAASSILSAGSFSPHWHDGASGIQVDPQEERMLSTSFITELLSSTSAPSDGGYSMLSHERRGVNDGRSIVDTLASEITYPPPRTGAAGSPYPGESSKLDGSNPPSSFALHGRHNPQPSSSGPRTADGSKRQSDSTGLTDVSGLGPLGISQAGSVFHPLRSMSVLSDHASARPSALTGITRPQSSTSSSTPLREAFNGIKAPIDEDTPLAARRTPPGSSTKPSWRGSKFARRDSLHSTKTTRSKVSSLISRISNSRPANWIRKPLPPVPILPNIPISQEEVYRNEDGQLALPELTSRARTLSNMLERGYHPHQSLTSLSQVHLGNIVSDEDMKAGTVPDRVVHATATARPDGSGLNTRNRKPGFWNWEKESSLLHSPRSHSPSRKNRRVWLLASVGVGVVLASIFTAVGVTLGSRHHSSTTSCGGNLTGLACDLDATCVCVSTSSSQCVELAQAILTRTPTMNQLFSTNLSDSDVATAIWEIQGTPTKSNCAEQAVLIDVAPALDSTTAPNRTQWAQSALLWNLIRSHNTTQVGNMQTFVRKADWDDLGTAADGPVPDTSGRFAFAQSGYIWNFANQTVAMPSATFVVTGEPSQEQIDRVGSVAHGALDRMYTFATASSTQRSTALLRYWESVLQQKADDLAIFRSRLSVAPVLLPFDATSSPGGHSVAALLTNSSANAFPPPLACYPGLNSTSLARIATIESTVFALSPASAASQFDPSCFPDRPIYGVLDLLQLRLPFTDARTGTAKQAVALNRDVNPRVIVYYGEALSAMPGAPTLPTLASTAADPREFGTLNNFDHVLFTYLSSIPDIGLATDLVQFVLGSPVVPPNDSSLLVRSLASIPTLEVAVFGSVLPSDVSFVASSFATPNGSLFFGSDSSNSLRDWSLVGTSSSIVWTNSTTAPLVVHDTSLADETFSEVWTPAYEFFHSPNNAVVNVGNITQAFEAVGLFSP